MPMAHYPVTVAIDKGHEEALWAVCEYDQEGPKVAYIGVLWLERHDGTRIRLDRVDNEDRAWIDDYCKESLYADSGADEECYSEEPCYCSSCRP